jgi:ribosomal protein S18 acetylase RimI-like enzyme
VPRTWALTWLAGAHREPEPETPAVWRERWEAEAAAFGTPGMPSSFLDSPNAGQPMGTQQVVANQASLEVLARVRRVVLPALVREAEDRGWWRPSLAWAGRGVVAGTPVGGAPGAPAVGPSAAVASSTGVRNPEVRVLDAASLSRLRLAPRTIPPFDPADGLTLLRAAAAGGARIVGAIDGDVLVGVAVAAAVAPTVGRVPGVAAVPSDERLLAVGVAPSEERLLVVGVAPAVRGRGVGRAMLRLLVEGRAEGVRIRATVNVAERDVVEPLDVAERMAIATRLLRGAGFDMVRVSPDISRDDPWAIEAVLGPR